MHQYKQGRPVRYEKTLSLAPGRKYVLEFEAIYCMAKVYVNDQLAADHPYGYTPIQVPLADYMTADGEARVRLFADGIPETCVTLSVR